jgi:hypothetical protein
MARLEGRAVPHDIAFLTHPKAPFNQIGSANGLAELGTFVQ